MYKELETEKATTRLKHELHGAVDTMHVDLARVEILAAALAAFSQPVPDYEPNFQHLRYVTASATQI